MKIKKETKKLYDLGGPKLIELQNKLIKVLRRAFTISYNKILKDLKKNPLILFNEHFREINKFDEENYDIQWIEGTMKALLQAAMIEGKERIDKEIGIEFTIRNKPDDVSDDVIRESINYKTEEKYIDDKLYNYNNFGFSHILSPNTNQFINKIGIRQELDNLYYFFKYFPPKILNKKPKIKVIDGEKARVWETANGVDIVLLGTEGENSFYLRTKHFKIDDFWGEYDNIDDILDKIPSDVQYYYFKTKTKFLKDLFGGRNSIGEIIYNTLTNKEIKQLNKAIEKDVEQVIPDEVNKTLLKKLNKKEQQIAKYISKAWNTNQITPHGYGTNSYVRTQLFKQKEKYIRKALNLLDGKNTKNIKHWYNDGVLYFEVGGRQVSFHTPSYIIDDYIIPNEYSQPWVGKRTRENPLLMTNKRYKEFLEAKIDSDEFFGENKFLKEKEKELRQIYKEVNKSPEVRLGAGFGLKNEEIEEYTLQYIDKQLSYINETTRKRIGAIIQKGINEGWGYNTIAKEIKKDYALSDYRARLIAAQELGQAYVDGERKQFDKYRKHFRETGYKKWIVHPDERLCPICNGNAQDGWIPADQPHSSGHMHPLAHIKCRCREDYRLFNPDE